MWKSVHILLVSALLCFMKDLNPQKYSFSMFMIIFLEFPNTVRNKLWNMSIFWLHMIVYGYIWLHMIAVAI